MDVPLRIRWLGVAGIELTADGQVLAIDPFLTRPPLRHLWYGGVPSDRTLVARHIRHCDYVLVSHAHWDHLMDVPEVLAGTRATALGSSNACRLLRAAGVPTDRIAEIRAGQSLQLGPYRVEVLPAEHGGVLGRPVLAGAVPPSLKPPFRLRDYRADCYFSFLVRIGGRRLLDWCSVGSGPAVEADLLFVGPAKPSRSYEALLGAVRPRAVVPVHWDDFFRPLSQPLQPMLGPPALALPPLQHIDLGSFRQTIEQVAPGTLVFLPEILRSYDVSELLARRQAGHPQDPAGVQGITCTPDPRCGIM